MNIPSIFFDRFSAAFTQSANNGFTREHLLMDFDWRFAGTGYFSYLAKASYGDGAAAKNFDDRGWRKLNLPHLIYKSQHHSGKDSMYIPHLTSYIAIIYICGKFTSCKETHRFLI
ncbi:MAG: hypothetical protein ABI594_04225 [Ginsengibacter sp.]